MRVGIELRRRLLGVTALLAYIISIYIVVSEVQSPTNIRIEVQEGLNVYVEEVNHLYTIYDVVMIIVFTAVATASGIYLFLQLTRRELRHRMENLSLNERRIYEIIASMGGVALQSEIVDKSGLSKSMVSIILDKLEARGLIERRRKGLFNVIILKK
ncbi:MAG: hypothetical protein DRJ32_02495 [Thermoprotei archaeon]|nr:MAG: hypothetical protein DRJ32_02495 [Thermoprotei archaeon]HDD64150.1 MarR family transcriptional regulator [Thermoprotei archaeon]